MRLLVLLAAALLLTAVHAQAQVYEPYGGYDEYDGYGYEDPYSPYPPPPYYEPEPGYQEPLQERREPSTRSARGTIIIYARPYACLHDTIGRAVRLPHRRRPRRQTVVRNNSGRIETIASGMATHGQHEAEESKASGSREARPRQSAWNPRDLSC